jgi:hypothetical protein
MSRSLRLQFGQLGPSNLGNQDAPWSSPRNAEVFKLSIRTLGGLDCHIGGRRKLQSVRCRLTHALISKAFSQVECRRRGLEIAGDLPVAHRECVQRGVATMLAQV